MMSDPTTVDGTTVDELTGKLVLLIEEPRSWDDPAQMHRQLAAKVKNYVRHIRSTEHDRPPSETIVRLLTTESPAAATLQFFTRVSYELSKHGIAFEHQVGEDGLPEPITPEAEAATPGAAAPPSPGPVAPAPSDRVAGPEPSPADEAEGEIEESAAAEPARPADVDEDEREEPAAASGADWLPEFEPLDEEGWEPEIASREEGEAAESTATESDPRTTEVPPEAEVEEYVDELESLARPDDERPKYPPFFPEEEFGRAVHQLELEAEDEGEEEEELDFATPVIETGSGKKILIEDTGLPDADELERVSKGERPSLLRALGSALSSAVAGSIIWGLLALLADQSAAPLALAVALMVGMSVRVRGGHTVPFRIVSGVATLSGSVLGAAFASIALTAKHSGEGLGAVLALVTDPNGLLEAVLTYFSLIDVGFVAVALYIAVRIAVAKR